MRDLSSNYITDCWSVLRMRHFATHEKICLHLLDWSNLWKSALKLAMFVGLAQFVGLHT